MKIPGLKMKTGEFDPVIIDINDDYEVQYWTKALGISKEFLIASVVKVGNFASEVKRDIKNKLR